LKSAKNAKKMDSSTIKQNLHQINQLLLPVEIPKQLVEIYTYIASTERSLNLTPFDKIGKSGDGGGSSITVGK
jgi:hypothetical protein